MLPLTTEAAAREKRFAPWADHRTYMEVSFARAYQTVRDGVRAGDPEGHIALSGTQVTNPWNGCDWYRLDAVIDDFISYSAGTSGTSTARSPSPARGSASGPATAAAARRHARGLDRGAAGRAAPADVLELLDHQPRHDFLASGRDLGEAFKALRFEGVGRLLMEAERLDDGVAVHYSMPSVHAAGILGQHEQRGRAEARRQPELHREPRRLGEPPRRPRASRSGFLASPQVEAGALAGERVLVLPYSTALSDREVAEIRRFVEAGGLLLVDAASGLFDEHVAGASPGRSTRSSACRAAAAPRARVSKARARGVRRGRRRQEAQQLGLRLATVAGSRPSSPRCARGSGPRSCTSAVPQNADSPPEPGRAAAAPLT